MSRVNHTAGTAASNITSDIVTGSLLLRLLPQAFHPYALLARWDRPIGVWLMLLPGLWGLCLAAPQETYGLPPLSLWLLFLIGGWAMRGAGCTINDILDRKLDAQVARTAMRPLANGTISLRRAILWLVLQLFVGLIVLLQLPLAAQLFGIAALPLIFLYPLMKRITWWPQAWLGLTFNWGFWIGAAVYTIPLQPVWFLLYLGALCWTLGYDTIYAVQDRDDDAQIGVRSTARLWGVHAPQFVYVSYIAAFTFWFAAGLQLPPFYFLGWGLAALCGAWLLRRWRPGPEKENLLSARRAFVRNQYVGLAMLLGILLTKL